MDLTDLFAYSDRCRKLMRETLLASPDLLYQTYETTSRFKSIAEIFAHSIGAELRWQDRIAGITPQIYENHPAATIEGLCADADAARAKTYAFIASLEEGGLARPIMTQLGDFETVMTIEQILFHVLNNENYHRGQIVTALQRLGADPPNFDYCFLHQD